MRVHPTTIHVDTKQHRLWNVLDAEFFDFLVVILVVEDIPLGGAFGDAAALALDFAAGGFVEPLFAGQEIFEDAADFLADIVVAFEELDVLEAGELLGGGCGELVEFFAGESHSTALYFFTSSFLTRLNISW